MSQLVLVVLTVLALTGTPASSSEPTGDLPHGEPTCAVCW